MMEKVKGYFSDWTPFEKCWQIFVIAVTVVTWYLNHDNLYMLIMSLVGCCGVIIGAKGKVEVLWLGTITSLMYAWLCFGLKLYGEVMYNILYSIPMNMLCIYNWKKNMQNGKVQFRTMSPRLIGLSVGATAIGVAGYMQFLKYIGGNWAFMDSLTTVVSVIGSLLYLMRYAEQWLMWVFINILQVIMWIVVVASGEQGSLLVILMKSISVINSTYAYFCWRKMAKESGGR